MGGSDRAPRESFSLYFSVTVAIPCGLTPVQAHRVAVTPGRNLPAGPRGRAAPHAHGSTPSCCAHRPGLLRGAPSPSPQPPATAPLASVPVSQGHTFCHTKTNTMGPRTWTLKNEINQQAHVFVRKVSPFAAEPRGALWPARPPLHSTGAPRTGGAPCLRTRGSAEAGREAALADPSRASLRSSLFPKPGLGAGGPVHARGSAGQRGELSGPGPQAPTPPEARWSPPPPPRHRPAPPPFLPGFLAEHFGLTCKVHSESRRPCPQEAPGGGLTWG